MGNFEVAQNNINFPKRLIDVRGIANPKAFSLVYFIPRALRALGMKYTKLKAEGLAIPIASINRFGKCYYHYVFKLKGLLNFTE